MIIMLHLCINVSWTYEYRPHPMGTPLLLCNPCETS